MEKVTDYSFLPIGKSNAIPSAELAALMGFNTVRELQSDIAAARAAGQIILSSTNAPGGYYRSNDPQELEEFVRTLRARAVNTFVALRSAKMALTRSRGQIEGQVDFDDLSDVWRM